MEYITIVDTMVSTMIMSLFSLLFDKTIYQCPITIFYTNNNIAITEMYKICRKAD